MLAHRKNPDRRSYLHEDRFSAGLQLFDWNLANASHRSMASIAELLDDSRRQILGIDKSKAAPTIYAHLGRDLVRK
jgi:hypothetical protein